MNEVWKIHPNKGLGPLQFGMTQAQVAAFEDIMGPLEETTEQTLADGNIALNEFRSSDAPACLFQDGKLTYMSTSRSDIIDVRFRDVSIYSDNPKHVYSTLGREAGKVYWCLNRVVMPSLGLELAGFVVEYSPKGKPPVFESKRAGFTWPQLNLFQPGHGLFKDSDLIEISNEAP